MSFFNSFRAKLAAPVSGAAVGVPADGSAIGVPADDAVNPNSMQGWGAAAGGVGVLPGLIKGGMGAGVGAPGGPLDQLHVMPAVPGVDSGLPIDPNAGQALPGAAMGGPLGADTLQAKSALRQSLLHRMHLMQA